MRRSLLVVALAVLVTLSGCAALEGSSDDADPAPNVSGVVELEDPTRNATNTTQSIRVVANESVAGDEWTSLSVEYPRENFTVDSVQHRDVVLGVDTDNDSTVDQELNETHISGVNTNDYSFTIELDTDYAFEAGDVMVVEYPDVDNPSEPGQYTIEVTLNEAQTETATVTIADESTD